MAGPVSLVYCMQYGGEYFKVGDLVRVTYTDTTTMLDAVVLGKVEKLTTSTVVLDCSVEYDANMVTVPLESITEITAELII